MNAGANPDVISMGSDAPTPEGVWPDSLGRRVKGVEAHITAITKTLRHNDHHLTEEHIWEAVAAAHSPEWTKARDRLNEAEKTLAHMRSDEHAPLGLVGSALDFDETTRAEENHIRALTVYTILNEELHATPALQSQQNLLHTHWSMIERAVQMAREAEAITRKEEKPEEPQRKLSMTFGKFATALFRKPQVVSVQHVPG